MYDVYVMGSASTLAKARELLKHDPAFAHPAIQASIAQHASQPDLLSQDLTAEAAVRLLTTLRSFKVLSYLVPSAYRQPKVSQTQAFQIAQQEAQTIQAKRYPDDKSFSEVQFQQEEPYCWTFRAQSEHHKKIWVRVDKLDGHIWSSIESGRMMDGTYFLQSRDAAYYIARVDWTEHYKHYDIFLESAAYTLPQLDDLAQEAPLLALPSIQASMLRPTRPGFLGLDLTLEKAIVLIERLRIEEARGYLLPSAYRQPLLSKEQALPLAQQAIEALRIKHVPEEMISPVQFNRERPFAWSFQAMSPSFAEEEGGGLYASVDKLDGHIWQEEEFDRLAR